MWGRRFFFKERGGLRIRNLVVCNKGTVKG